MDKFKYFSLFLLFIFCKSNFSQDSAFLFSFRIAEYPVFLEGENDTKHEEYIVLTSNPSGSGISISRNIFFGGYILKYNSNYIDSNISLILVKYPCHDTMIINFKPALLKNLKGVLCNFYIDNIPYFRGTNYINVPTAEQWSSIEPRILNPYDRIYYYDITSFQNWLFNLKYNFRTEKFIITFCFRIIDKKGKSISNKNKRYNISNELLYPGRAGRIDFDNFNFSYDTINNFWCAEIELSPWGLNEVVFDIIDESNDIKMSISLTPDIIPRFNCSYANLLTDSLHFKKGSYPIDFPKYKDAWEVMEKISLKGYSHDFADITDFQEWNK